MNLNEAKTHLAASKFLTAGEKVVFLTDEGELIEGKILSFTSEIVKVTNTAVTKMWKVSRDRVEKIDTPEVAKAKRTVAASEAIKSRFSFLK